MKLYKNEQVKDLRSPKSIERWTRFGWQPEGQIEVPKEPKEAKEEVKEDKPRRGRPRKVEE